MPSPALPPAPRWHIPAIRTRAADATQLKFATADTMQDTSYSVAQHFAGDVKQRTGGKYEMQLFVNGALGTALNLASSLQTGIIDCAILTTGWMQSFVPTVQVVDMPFLFKEQISGQDARRPGRAGSVR